jgi:hypothetical protein
LTSILISTVCSMVDGYHVNFNTLKVVYQYETNVRGID